MPKASATEVQFLGAETGAELAGVHGKADLVVGNNVYAHIPDLIGFTAGLAALVKPDGMITLEFPHLLRLIERRQFDTIYHEHYHYLSLLTASRALATADLRVVDVDELSTHGGSLRVYAQPATAAGEPASSVKAVLDAEEAAGLHTVPGHAGFADDVFAIKRDLLTFLRRSPHQRAARRRVRRTGQGQHPAQPLRHSRGPARLHRRSQPAQAGPVPPRNAHPDPRTRAHRRRTSPTTY